MLELLRDGVVLVLGERERRHAQVEHVGTLRVDRPVMPQEHSNWYLHKDTCIGEDDDDLEIRPHPRGIHTVLGRRPVLGRVHEEPDNVEELGSAKQGESELDVGWVELVEGED